MATSTTIGSPADWTDFLARLPETSPLRGVIQQSWGRCRAAGVDPRNSPLHRIPDDDLALRLGASSDLIAAARQHLDWISAILGATPHVVYVTDADAIVLLSTGNDPSLLRDAGLEPGYDWSERRMGTNGAGTALVTGRPEAVIGDEHFVEAFRGCTCTAAPILGADGEPVGAIDITTPRVEGTAERLMLAMHAARVIERDVEAARVSRRADALRRLATDLLAASPDPGQALTRLPRLLVSFLADWAVLHVPEPRGELRTSVAHRDPAAEPLLDRLWGRVPGPLASAAHPVAEVLRTGEPVLLPRLSDSDLDAMADDDDTRHDLRVLRPHSYLCVPLRSGERTLAVLLLASAFPSRAFCERDLALAEQLTSLAGLALENARVRAERDRIAELQLRAAEQIRLHSRLLQEVEQAVIATDLDGTILYWGRFAEELYGWTADEVIGRSVVDVTPAADLADPAGDIMRQVIAGRSWTGQFRVRRKDGSVFLAHVTDSPIRDATGQVVGVVGVSFDCTEQQRLMDNERAARAEAERRAAEAEAARRTLQALMDYVPEGITIASAPDVRILQVSRYGQNLVGRASDELTISASERAHANAWGILHMDATPARDDELPLTRAVRQGIVSTDEEWLLQRPDGSRITILTNAGPIRDDAGAITGGVIAWRDISERKAEERAARESEARMRELYQAADTALRARDEVLSVVSHDLRNPLNAISMASALLLEHELTEVTRANQLRIIRRASNQMLRLINDLLDAARIDAGGLRLEAESIHPRALVHEALSFLDPLMQEKGVSAAVHLAEPLPAVRADRTRIVQVLDNLLTNALRYSPAGETIDIRVESLPDEVLFTIADRGPGIPPEEREHVFERFWQGKRRNGGSAGLGLSICKGIVTGHGGRIWLDTRAAEGTTMCFTLPTERAATDQSR